MIITGNSNIDCFNRQGFKPAIESERVHIYWVGALKIRHFYEARPIGAKVRSILSAEEGWKFLSIGTHDIFQLYGAASQNMLDETFNSLMACYKEIFAEFNALGKFGWLVFPQPFHQVNFQNVTKKNMLDIARLFNRQVEALCADQGILVINPLKRILGEYGSPLSQYMQDDGSHVNQEGARIYLEEIRTLTKVEIDFQQKQSLFDPQSENESFCSLLLNNLNIPAARALSGNNLQSALAGFLKDRLKQKGHDINVDEHTELINSRLLNTLDLVETFTFASNAMHLDIAFDANLWELNTTQKIIEFLINKKGGCNKNESDTSPVQSDFLLSMRGDFGNPHQKEAIIDAEHRISLMNDELFELFKENVIVASEGYICPYGIVLFWIALNQAQRGDYKGALALLAQAGSPQRLFPFSSSQCQFYKTTWTERAVPYVWEQKPNETLLYTKTNTLLNNNADTITAHTDALSLAQSGDSKKAIRLLNDLLNANPDYAPAHNDLAVLYGQSGDNEKALQHYEAAVRTQPDSTTFLKNLADFYFTIQTDTEKALQVYIKGLSINPGDIEILMALGNISLQNRQFESAKDFYHRVLTIDPYNNEALKSIDLLNNQNRVMTAGLTADATTVERTNQSEGYLVSAIVSAYNSERFIRGCIEDLEAQTIADRLEIVIVDSCSPQNERVIVEEMQRKYSNINYIRTDKRETVYAAWNRGIKAASGKYITNANTDDRHRHDALEIMVNELERKPNIALVYADVIMTEKENETFNRHTPCGNFQWLDWDRKRLLEEGCFMGPQPMWRRTIHDEYGYFDDLMVTSGDYEFWLRISQTNNFYHINTPLGLYLKSPESIEHSNREKQREENYQILSLYRDAAQKGRILKYSKSQRDSVIDKKSFISGLTSIVIHSFNNLKHLRQCIQELEKFTPEKHEIVFVDYNSPADIKKWLKKQIEAIKHYTYITADRDQGFVGVLNKGINKSSGEFVVLLSSDVMVSENWLSDMLSCLQGTVKPAIVGPMADNVLEPQNIQDTKLKTLEGIEVFRERNRHRRVHTVNLEGFCLLFRRTLLLEIGLFDETFVMNKYVFNDFCFRATLAGYINVIAGDVFLHNYGSLMSGNIKIFDEKWTGLDLNTPLGKKVAALNSINKAEALNQKGELDQAIAMLIEGMRFAPEEKVLYYHLAEMLLDNKLYKDALDAIDSMPLSAKDDLRCREIIAYCKEGLGETGEYADRILEVDKNSAPALNLKGMKAYKQGDHGAAENLFGEAIAANPGYGEPYTNLGIMKWASDQREEALDCLEKGFILSPTQTDNVALYHSAITELEQFARAEGFIRDAKALHPENKRILFFLIDMLIKQDKFIMAMDEIERAMLDIGIDDGMLAAALQIRNKVGIKEIDKTEKNKGTLSLCMIVKNEEQHLARCLLSAKPAVDEMIIVDTGSTDRTKDIAQAYGARVFDFPWTNDFSIARNQSLSMATGDWVLVLDADEVISPLDYAALEKIVKKRPAKAVAYTMVTRNYTNEVAAKGWTANDRKYGREEAGTGWFPSLKVRLFINDSRIRFQNPVHEFVEASLEKAGIGIKAFDVPVHHYGRFDRDKLIMKGRKYFLLGKQKIEEMKGDINALMELAVQASELGEYETGVELWKKVIELDRNHSAAFLNISYAYLKLEKYQEALLSSRRALELEPTMKEAALNYAGSELFVGDINKTISILETLLQRDPDYPPAMALVAAAYYISDQKEAGLGLFEKLRKRGFNCTEFLDEQYHGVLSQGKLDQAISLLEVAIKTGNISKDTHRLFVECQNKRDNQHV